MCFSKRAPIETQFRDFYIGDPVHDDTMPMDTPRKIGYGSGADRLDSGPSVLAPGPLAAGPVYNDPLVPAPGHLAAGPLYNDDADWINAVGVKLPEFWQSKVRRWFAQAEAQFATIGISTSLTKY